MTAPQAQEKRPLELVSLIVALDMLRRERDLKDEAQTTVENLMATFAADHEEEYAALALARHTVQRLEARLRPEIEAEYERQGSKDKKIAPGATIVDKTTVEVTDKAAAEAWCRNRVMFLSLDESAYKSFAAGEAKAGRELPPGVTVTTKPTAQIATKIPPQDIPESYVQHGVLQQTVDAALAAAIENGYPVDVRKAEAIAIDLGTYYQPVEGMEPEVLVPFIQDYHRRHAGPVE